ncbi:metallophosphoesterase [Enterocloster sp. OA13]|uniref:metallophosphoesterase family protein n=1 Tax=Enterocloster sp. OA13 TaxID=2914161 RepID=UPI000472AF91|nr:metallophosphoesterase [Enterocloster sp. OA13]
MNELRLMIKLKNPDGADGGYRIIAPGFMMAVLFWADKEGHALPDWTPFAYVPLISGSGSFDFSGKRAIPETAVSVLCRAVSEDCSQIRECLQFIPGEIRKTSAKSYCFAVASDLHISNKATPFEKLYDFATGSDGLLLAGDTVNDGSEQQFEFLKSCVMENWRRYGIFLPIYTVAGNHDIPLKPTPSIGKQGQGGYPMFQKWMKERNESVGIVWNQDVSGAYAVPMEEHMEIIGIQCVSHFRRFVFHEGRQLEWLSNHLDETKGLKWHIILCHAPLLNHNPQRKPGKDAPYLSRDDRLQHILDTHRNIIFISGHTHFSLNNLSGCVEWDEFRENLYLNVGSIRKTTMHTGEVYVPSMWTEGSGVLLRISESDLEITTVGLYSGKKQARGYYQFNVKAGQNHAVYKLQNEVEVEMEQLSVG